MKKIIKSIACCCLSIALAIGCCFGAMKMSKNQRFLGTSCNKASAYVYQDEKVPYTFTSDSFLIPTFPISSDSNSVAVPHDYFLITLISFSFSRQMGNTPFQISANIVSKSTDSGTTYTTNDYELIYFRNSPQVIDFTNTSVYKSKLYFYVSNINMSVDFVKVRLSNYLYYDLEKPESVTFNFISFTFFNSLDEYVTIFVPTGTATPSTSSFTRFFYTDDVTYFLNSSAQFNNNEFYNSGYNNGYDLGYTEGETEGYNNGYSQGQTEGYNNGYTQGLESSERLGFPALITSVIDVPVKVFTSLFNFEILGVNILTFVTSLLTIALILAIVRKVKSD